MRVVIVFFISSVFLGLMFFTYVTPADAQEDILEVVGDKYYLNLDGKDYRVLYGYGSSFEVSQEHIERDLPDLKSIDLNVERKSLEIQLENVNESFLFWLLPDPELISAESYNFQVLVNDKITLYDLVIQAKGPRIGFVIPPGTQSVEIIGTKVIPEFQTILVFIFMVSVLCMVIFSKMFSFSRLVIK